MIKRRRHVGLLCAASLSALSACATGGPTLLMASFDAGLGPQGEMCRADRRWSDPVVQRNLDVSYDLRCRGWTDTQSVGRLYGVGAAAAAAIAENRQARLHCGDAAPVSVPGFGQGMASRCYDREGGYEAFALTVERDGYVYAVDGLARFKANLIAGLHAVAANAKGALADIELSTLRLPASRGEPALVVRDDALEARRGEVLDYSVRGQHGEAREIVTRYLAKLPETASPADRVEFLFEAALSESNLGYAEVAAAYLNEAEAILTGPSAPRSTETLLPKLKIYRAMDALNRRSFASAADMAAAALASLDEEDAIRLAALDTAPLKDPMLLRQLNRPVTTGTLRSADREWTRTAMLRAHGLYIKGAALRARGNLIAASASLDEARVLLARFDDRAVEASNTQWLRSAVASERGRVALRQGQPEVARAAFAEAVSRLEGASIYADTPLLAQRHLDFAEFLASRGERDQALAEYAKAMDVLQQGGPSAAAGVTGLSNYFALLADAAQGTGPAAAEAKARFFLASQFINPPAIAAQIAQIQKIFESGSSDTAVRAKTLQDLDRESRALSTRIAGLPAEAAQDRARLQAELDEVNARAATVRQELSGNEQYQQVKDMVASLDEVKRRLRPGEAYFKTLVLPAVSYGILITPETAQIYPLKISAPELDRLVKTVRQSIDGNVLADGRVVPLVFDVAAAHRLYSAVLGPAGRALAGVTTVITEPSGVMTQLPLGVLVTDQASVDWFQSNVKKNSRDYSQVRFLARQADISTTVSPRAFLVARGQAPSRAAKPYIGFGSHLPPAGPTLASLPQRGALAGRCAAKGEALAAAFGSLRPIGSRELETASKVLGPGSEIVTGAAFTDMALDKQRDYRNFAVVHFATHGLKEGELDCDSPPALVTTVAPEGDSDGLLSFEEIANLQLDANLVVLSACNTAAETSSARGTAGAGFRTGRAGQGATLNGLVRAFLVAGSRTVLTTHWAIPDSFRTRDGREVPASTRLMESMFQAGSQSSISRSLREAQSTMIGNIDTSHPYYWAAFAVVGDGSKSMLSPAA